MALQGQKVKILCLMQILMEQTDQQHTMTAQELISALNNQYGITSERKSIYTDIEILQEFGIDIIQVKGKKSGYYVGSREFELPELKLLVDAVQVSKFITPKKTEELIRKLERLTNQFSAEELQREVYIFGRPKAENESIYYGVNDIHTAILANQQIDFQYAEWTVKRELVLKKSGEHYVVSPWKLTWDDENYYLIGYDEKAECIKHYRVDKMKNISVLPDKRQGKKEFQNFNLAAFAKKTFGMYGGREAKVGLLCNNEIAGVIIDRFGKDTMLIPKGENHFQINVEAVISHQFFGWITGVGNRIKIVSPKDVKEEYEKYLKEILQRYEN